MGEINETIQDSLQKPGQTSGGEGEITPKQTKTYTEEDVQKAINDALAAKGRDAKRLSDWEASLKAQQTEIEATRGQIAEVQKRMDEAELEAAKGDPAKLREYQSKKSYKDQLASLETMKKDLQKQRAEIERSKAEHEAEIKATQETQLEIKLWEIAAEAKVDPVLLKETMKELNLTSVDQARSLAKRLSAGQRPPEEFNPVSGVTSGSGEPTQEQLEKMPMDEYAAYVKKRDAKK